MMKVFVSILSILILTACSNEVINHNQDINTNQVIIDASEEEKILDDYVGIWHKSPVMAAGWSDNYHFFNDGTYKFYYSQMVGDKRTIDESGTWVINEEGLIITIYEKTIVEGGKIVDDVILGKTIEGGTIKTIRNSHPDTITLSFSRDIKIDPENNREFIEINGEKYWKFSDDPSEPNI